MNRDDIRFADHLREMGKQYEKSNKEKAIELAELAIIYLAEATMNNITKINNVNVDVLKNRAWLILEKTGVVLKESKYPKLTNLGGHNNSDIKVYVFENNQTKEQFKGTRKEFTLQYQASPGEVSKIINKVRKAYKGWTVIQ